MTDLTCSKPECPIATTGRCLEAFDPPETCPYLNHVVELQEEVTSYKNQELIDLPSGEALSDRQASDVARDDETIVVLIAGPLESGKTTILTSLFEAFQEAPFGNFLFRGSKTLIGFEKRCHLGREQSGAEEPHTLHTSMREGVVFLHLALASIDGSNFRHANLLLSDISGEIFRKLRDSSDAAKELPALQRTDRLCLAIDGAKITDLGARQVARNDSRSILRSIIESGMLADKATIDIAFTKWDLIVDAIEGANGQQVSAFLNATRQALEAAAAPHAVRFHEIAARPARKAKIPFAHGLPTLLRSWMSREIEGGTKLPLYVSAAPDREFDRYSASVIKSKGLGGQFDVRTI